MERDTLARVFDITFHSVLWPFNSRCYNPKLTVNSITSTRLNRPQDLHAHGQIGPWLSTNLRPRGHPSGLSFFHFFYSVFFLSDWKQKLICFENLRWRMPRENSNDNNSLSTCVHDRIKNGQTQGRPYMKPWLLRKLKYIGRYRTRHLLHKVRFTYPSFRQRPELITNEGRRHIEIACLQSNCCLMKC